MLLMFTMGTAYQKCFGFVFLFVLHGFHEALFIMVPWNGEKVTTYLGDSRFVTAFKALFHPMTALAIAVYYDSDLYDDPEEEKKKKEESAKDK